MKRDVFAMGMVSLALGHCIVNVLGQRWGVR